MKYIEELRGIDIIIFAVAIGLLVIGVTLIKTPSHILITPIEIHQKLKEEIWFLQALLLKFWRQILGIFFATLSILILAYTFISHITGVA